MGGFDGCVAPSAGATSAGTAPTSSTRAESLRESASGFARTGVPSLVRASGDFGEFGELVEFVGGTTMMRANESPATPSTVEATPATRLDLDHRTVDARRAAAAARAASRCEAASGVRCFAAAGVGSLLGCGGGASVEIVSIAGEPTRFAFLTTPPAPSFSAPHTRQTIAFPARAGAAPYGVEQRWHLARLTAPHLVAHASRAARAPRALASSWPLPPHELARRR